LWPWPRATRRRNTSVSLLNEALKVPTYPTESGQIGAGGLARALLASGVLKGVRMRKLLVAAGLTLGLMTPAAANAQTFITPFAGVTFGADSPGEQFSTGASLLFMGNVAGFELEFGYTPDFFKESDEITLVGDSNVTSLSANLVIGVGGGPVRPYVTGGVGLLRSHITSAEDFFDEVSTNDFGVNAGAVIIVLFSEHVGLRGDVRYFRNLQEIDVSELAVTLDSFDFWRAYGGVAFKF
jgi:opacity protein-like surface antigen